MNIINKEFIDRSSKERFKVVDVYKNIAITNTRERIDTTRLLDSKYYDMVGINSTESLITESIVTNDGVVDPSKFFNNTHNAFAETINRVDLSTLPIENQNSDVHSGMVSMVNDRNYPPQSESAIVMVSEEDEVEELKKKYGVTDPVIHNNTQKTMDSLSKYLDEPITTVTIDPPIHQQPQIEVPKIYEKQDDPIVSIFKGVKRTLNFSIDLKLDGKIPRLDFIEMMEDSYEHSIIDYLSTEFTNQLMNNPADIKDKISKKIKSMIEKNKKEVSTKPVRKKTTKSDTGNLP